MRSLNLKTKLALGSGTVILLLALNSVFSFYAARRLVTIAEQSDADLRKKEMTLRIELAVRKQVRAANDFTFTGETAALDRYAQATEEAAQNLRDIRQLLTTDTGRTMLTNIEQSTTVLSQQTDQQIALRRQQRTYEATDLAFSAKALAAMKQLGDDCIALEEREEQRAQESRANQHAIQASNQRITLVLVIAGILIGVFTSALIARSIGHNVDRMLGMLRQLAANNLSLPDLEIGTHDEIGEACLALNATKNSLRRVIQSIVEAVEHVASASEQISSSASRQSAGAATQKDRTAQVATAMQQMSSSVQQVSEHSKLAADASHHAAETARDGGTIVDDTLAKMRSLAASVSGTAIKMEELGKSSDQIGRIAGVIDDIADQTNLLALNAAIEAARAGEQGRGFAVVADEVRKLAERTTTATKEIAEMIKNIQNETREAVAAMEAGTRQAEEGVQSTTQAGDALKKIIQTSEQVGEMITHIATAATQQSSASEEINTNMNEIAKLVKESSNGAQQSAKACQDLSDLALNLHQTVGNFNLGETTSSARNRGEKSLAAIAGRSS